MKTVLWRHRLINKFSWCHVADSVCIFVVCSVMIRLQFHRHRMSTDRCWRAPTICSFITTPNTGGEQDVSTSPIQVSNFQITLSVTVATLHGPKGRAIGCVPRDVMTSWQLMPWRHVHWLINGSVRSVTDRNDVIGLIVVYRRRYTADITLLWRRYLQSDPSSSLLMLLDIPVYVYLYRLSALGHYNRRRT